ncbi:hypothetical protein E1B28_005753 [Marasmius oreades]|uniref:N-acetyltransferase domain-containing protein n=1 Tax=Marasmius oreades TaxID=181124 RepID=A0A9P7UUK6_9AGAR|nr:uncharacterized protein E1B28_005753 [Marasmius oreades]KAG7094952.1 hypothetical protein E1B28_005753 [Marasmius oreades]
MDFLPFGPYHSVEGLVSGLWEGRVEKNPAETLFVVYDKTRPDANGQPSLAGTIGYVNSNAADLCTEIGCVIILPQFHRTHVASNAVGLLMHYALDLPENGGLGCRRVQWMANKLNTSSVRLAEKMGFVLEGIIRWHRVIPPSKSIAHNGSPGRKGDPHEGYLARDTAMLGIYWDIWDNGGREKVDLIMERRK